MSERHNFLHVSEFLRQAKEARLSPGPLFLPGSWVTTKSCDLTAQLFSEPLMVSASFTHFFAFSYFKFLFSCECFSTTNNDRAVLQQVYISRAPEQIFLKKETGISKTLFLLVHSSFCNDIISYCWPDFFFVHP